MKKDNKIKYAMNILFFLYFVILIAERGMSIILSFIKGVKIIGHGFNFFAYFSIILSIISFILFIIFKCNKELKALFIVNDESIENINFYSLLKAAGLILISGMVHSEFTTSIMQFVSYGFLIVAFILQAILNQKECKNKCLLWLSTFYLISYSMAIPVIYPSLIDLHIIFHVIEGFSSFLLLGIFVHMTIVFFKNQDSIFMYSFIIPCLVLDSVLIFMRWNEEINLFLLIFVSLSVVLFVLGKIIELILRRRNDV